MRLTNLKVSLLALVAGVVLFGSWYVCCADTESKGTAHGVTKANVQKQAERLVVPRPWASDKIWDDGTAEFAFYDVSWSRYGNHYSGSAHLITVKEPWNPDLEVKADQLHAQGFDVIKLNHIRSVQTGIYTYQQMASAFFPRQGGPMGKLTTTSAEACGQTTGYMTKGTLRTASYFDGQGERVTSWPMDALSEDALAFSLRDYLSGPVPETLSLFPSLLTGKLPELKASDYKVSRKDGGSVSVPAGSYQTTAIILKKKDRELTFWFTSKAPHTLVAYEETLGGKKGTRYELKKVAREPYWGMNGPGDESWYE